MMQSANPILSFFRVAFRGQTYLNIAYLSLAFPLGLFYFIFMVVGFSVGLALLIIWVGLLILPVVFIGWWAFAAFERQLAIWLLKEDIPPMASKPPTGQDVRARIGAYLTNPVTWKSLVYLFVKFPLGILSFTVLVGLGTLTMTFLATPLILPFFHPQIWWSAELVWEINTLREALLLFLVGVILLFPSLHVFNALAWVSGRFAWLMLGDFQPS